MRESKVDGENHEIGRHDPQGTARVESAQIQAFIARELRQKLAADQIPAKNKEKIYADSTPPVHAARQRKTHDAGVVGLQR